MNLEKVLFGLFLGGGIAISVGAICFCLMRLASAVEVGIGVGQTAEIKRALKAMEGQIDDAVGHFDAVTNRNAMREKRAAAGDGRRLPAAAVATDDRAARLAALRARAAQQTQQ